jgi:hypothetical protein
MLDEQHAKRAAVMLISDLADDPTDLTRLTDAVLAFQDRKIPLEIVALDRRANADFFRRCSAMKRSSRRRRFRPAAREGSWS